jgi:hypothetical protein
MARFLISERDGISKIAYHKARRDHSILVASTPLLVSLSYSIRILER